MFQGGIGCCISALTADPVSPFPINMLNTDSDHAAFTTDFHAHKEGVYQHSIIVTNDQNFICQQPKALALL